MILTRHGWLVVERRLRAPAAAARCGGGRRSWHDRGAHGGARDLCGRARSPPTSRGGLLTCHCRVPMTRLMARSATAPSPPRRYRSPGVTRAGTACRLSYRPSRRRSRYDAYLPPNYSLPDSFALKL